jgi:hypothetical protein
MNSEPLPRDEKDKALQVEQAAVQATTRDFFADPKVRDYANKVTAGPQYVTSISAMPRPEPGMPRVAQVTRYQYAGGITVHTYVDLETGKALSVTPYVNYPTPLAPEEVERAKRLAFEQVPEVGSAIVSQKGAELTVQALPVIVSSKAEPNYGHRIAILQYQAPGGAPLNIPPVHVDLTSGKAYAEQ